MRRLRYAPAAAISAANTSAPGDPATAATTPATAPAPSVPPTRPNTVSRELVRTKSISGGSTRGVTALFSTANDLLRIIMHSASGYSAQLSTLKINRNAITIRTANEAASATLRPCCNRSSSGPMSGAITANGAIVINRYSATLDFDSAVALAKNSVLASATAMAASRAKLAIVAYTSAVSPDRSAPSAFAARWKEWKPFSVSSMLRIATTRVTVNLRGTRWRPLIFAVSAGGGGSGAGCGGGSGCGSCGGRSRGGCPAANRRVTNSGTSVSPPRSGSGGCGRRGGALGGGGYRS